MRVRAHKLTRLFFSLLLIIQAIDVALSRGALGFVSERLAGNFAEAPRVTELGPLARAQARRREMAAAVLPGTQGLSSSPRASPSSSATTPSPSHATAKETTERERLQRERLAAVACTIPKLRVSAALRSITLVLARDDAVAVSADARFRELMPLETICSLSIEGLNAHVTQCGAGALSLTAGLEGLTMTDLRPRRRCKINGLPKPAPAHSNVIALAANSDARQQERDHRKWRQRTTKEKKAERRKEAKKKGRGGRGGGGGGLPLDSLGLGLGVEESKAEEKQGGGSQEEKGDGYGGVGDENDNDNNKGNDDGDYEKHRSVLPPVDVGAALSAQVSIQPNFNRQKRFVVVAAYLGDLRILPLPVINDLVDFFTGGDVSGPPATRAGAANDGCDKDKDAKTAKGGARKGKNRASSPLRKPSSKRPLRRRSPPSVSRGKERDLFMINSSDDEDEGTMRAWGDVDGDGELDSDELVEIDDDNWDQALLTDTAAGTHADHIASGGNINELNGEDGDDLVIIYGSADPFDLPMDLEYAEVLPSSVTLFLFQDPSVWRPHPSSSSRPRFTSSSSSFSSSSSSSSTVVPAPTASQRLRSGRAPVGESLAVTLTVELMVDRDHNNDGHGCAAAIALRALHPPPGFDPRAATRIDELFPGASSADLIAPFLLKVNLKHQLLPSPLVFITARTEERMGVHAALDTGGALSVRFGFKDYQTIMAVVGVLTGGGSAGGSDGSSTPSPSPSPAEDKDANVANTTATATSKGKKGKQKQDTRLDVEVRLPALHVLLVNDVSGIVIPLLDITIWRVFASVRPFEIVKVGGGSGGLDDIVRDARLRRTDRPTAADLYGLQRNGRMRIEIGHELKVALELAADYFNGLIGSWEPLVELWKVEANISMPERLDQKKRKKKKQSKNKTTTSGLSGSIGGGGGGGGGDKNERDKVPAKTSINVSSNKLRINVTKACIKSLVDASNLVSKITAAQEGGEGSAEERARLLEGVSTHFVENSTGLDLAFAVEGVGYVTGQDDDGDDDYDDDDEDDELDDAFAGLQNLECVVPASGTGAPARAAFGEFYYAADDAMDEAYGAGINGGNNAEAERNSIHEWAGSRGSGVDAERWVFLSLLHSISTI